ncbi:MAG: hypothetical protein K6E39_02905, partial [Lachnospiraceae bacterium]|nr:hypothetical protein [Lachnospiraceae bacterium]
MSKDILYARERAGLFLAGLNSKEVIEKELLLKNIDDEYEAIVFDLSGGGYIIVNIKSLSIPELSFKNRNPYSGYEDVVYNGGLE